MKAVHKYQLCRGMTFAVSIPMGAKLLRAEMQGDDPVIWAWVDTDQQPVNRVFAVIGTGWPAPEYDDDAAYVGTILGDDGFVWHVFDGGERD